MVYLIAVLCPGARLASSKGEGERVNFALEMGGNEEGVMMNTLVYLGYLGFLTVKEVLHVS